MYSTKVAKQFTPSARVINQSKQNLILLNINEKVICQRGCGSAKKIGIAATVICLYYVTRHARLIFSFYCHDLSVRPVMDRRNIPSDRTHKTFS